MKPRDIFGLAVRLLGLFFLYLGLRALTPLLDVEAVETAGTSDLVSALLPVAFDLAVAWWLLGGGVLVRRAYPEAPRERLASPPRQAAPAPESDASENWTTLDRAEQKLASLVERPKPERAK